MVAATFKGTRVLNSQSVGTPGQGTLAFLIQRRFGTLNSGAYDFFGLDQAGLRLGFEYGLTSRLAVGIGRKNTEKTFDGFLKYKALRQTTGARPLHVTNAQGMTEKCFVPQTNGDFFNGDIYFDFTVARNFTIKPQLKQVKRWELKVKKARRDYPVGLLTFYLSTFNP